LGGHPFRQLEAGYGHFFTGKYIQQSLSSPAFGSRDADWFYVQLNLHSRSARASANIWPNEKLTTNRNGITVALELREKHGRAPARAVPKIAGPRRGLPGPARFFPTAASIASWRFTSSNTSPTCRRRCARCIGCVIRSAASFPWSSLRRRSGLHAGAADLGARIFEKRYQQPYDWFIRREHLNVPAEILRELAPFFEITHRSFSRCACLWSSAISASA